MKTTVNIARILVGSLFIFSGLVKAIDPLGLSYKMQEFFEVWANDGYMKNLMMWLYTHALLFSLFMITLEVILGFALLIGWKKNITNLLLLLLTLFFTFLTAFVLFTGKIRACGCFGDCIPLTPVQTFTKDLVLLLLIFIIIFGRKYIQPLFKKELTSLSLTLLILFGVSFLQYYVLQHLPVKDCLPFKKGNDILELRKMPKDAIQDKFEYSFIYEKNGMKKEYTIETLPDSSWSFVERNEKLIEKGKNNSPLIKDFTLITESGTDTTEALLSQQIEYYLLFIKDEETYPKNWDTDGNIISKIFLAKKPLYIISSQKDFVKQKFSNRFLIDGNQYQPVILTCDGVAIKTAARNNPVLYLMKGPVVQGKWGRGDFDKVIK